MNKEDKLLELTEKLIHAIANNESFDSEEEKQSSFSMLESMQFFVEQGNYDRAISEGENLINKLNKRNK